MKEVSPLQILIYLIVPTCVFLFVRKVFNVGQSYRGYTTPPGPNGLPIIGYVQGILQPRPFQWALEQGEKYGELIFFKIMGRSMMYINSYSAAAELLEKRSVISSARPRLVMATELQGWDWYPAFLSDPERVREHRAMMHSFLQQSRIPEYNECQYEELHIMLKGLLHSPAKFGSHIRRFPGAVILRIAYGIKISVENDPLVKLGAEGVKAVAESELYFFLDFFPWLKYLPEWVPGASFHRVARQNYGISRALRDKPYELAKRKIKDGTALPSATSELLEQNTDEKGIIRNEEAIASTTGVMFAGGADTVVTTIMSAILAMVLYPEVLHKAQNELDRVVGKGNIPKFEDLDKLPYINAICTETYRWQPTVPLGVAHVTTSDDHYKGYYIPRDTLVLSNIWAMSKDPEMFPEPDAFKPERWLVNGAASTQLHPHDFVFGFGRRICTGRELAESTVPIGVASILACFDIKKSCLPDGQPVEPNAQFAESFLRTLDHFECTWSPRSAKLAELIDQL